MPFLRKDLRSGRWQHTKERRTRWGKKRRISKRRVILVIILALFFLLFINTNNIASFITREIMIYQIEKRVTFQLSCKSFKANIFTDRVIIEGAKIVSSNQFGEELFAYIPHIEGYFRYKSLFQKKLILDEFVYYQPVVFLECNKEGKWNLPSKRKYKRGHWLFAKPRWRVKDGRLIIKDGWVAEEPFLFTFENIEGEAVNFSTQLPANATYSFSGQLASPGPALPVKGGGSIKSFRAPFDHTLYIEAEGLDLPSFKPYGEQITPLELTKGRMDLKSELHHLGRRFEGKNSLKIRELVLEGPGGFMISCPGIKTKLSFRFFPHQVLLLSEKRLLLEEVILSQPTLFLSRNKKGEWNLSPALKEKLKRWSLQVTSLETEKGSLIFRDEKVSHETLVTELKDIDLSIIYPVPITSAKTRYRLKAHLIANNSSAPLEAWGRIASLKRPLDFDLNLSLKGLNLVPFDPYQREATACRLTRGKMALKSELKCHKNFLEARNEVRFSDLKLEPLVELKPSSFKVLGMGPAVLATVLPDEKGQIRLSVPVEGSIDDPDFKLTAAITKALLKSVQEKMIQPFRLAARLVPGRKGWTRIQFIPLEFVEGTVDLTQDSLKRLTQLGSFLSRYPIALLHIEGYVDPVTEKGVSALSRARKVADFFIQKFRIPLESLYLVPKEEKDKKGVEIRVEENED